MTQIKNLDKGKYIETLIEKVVERKLPILLEKQLPKILKKIQPVNSTGDTDSSTPPSYLNPSILENMMKVQPIKEFTFNNFGGVNTSLEGSALPEGEVSIELIKQFYPKGY